MNNMIEYKGYHAQIQFDAEDEIFFGTVIGLNDKLGFHGNTVDELKIKFANAIDDYLDLCEKIGKQPEKEYKGSLNIRIPSETHRQLVLLSAKRGCSLNSTIESILTKYTNGEFEESKTIVIWNQEQKDTSKMFSTKYFMNFSTVQAGGMYPNRAQVAL